MGVANIIKVAIVGDERGLSEAVRSANGDLKKLSENANSHLSKASAVSKRALAVIGAGGLALVGIALKNGDALNESQDQLANALANTGASYDKLGPQISKVQKTSESLGFTNRETNDALTAGVTATGSFHTALGLLGVAQDLARKKHIDLAQAEIVVAKASEGQLKPLKALGIDLPIAAGGAVKTAAAYAKMTTASNAVKLVEAAIHAGRLKGKAATDALFKANFNLSTATDKYNTVAKAGDGIVAGLARRISGSAAVATESLKGKTEVLKAKFTDMTAHLGQKLIPIVLQVGEKFGQLVEWFTKNKVALDILLVAIGLLVAGMVALAVIDKVQKAVEGLQKVWGVLNAVMDANPLVLAAIAFVAVGVAVYEAYKHFGPFRTAVDDVWQALQVGFHWVQKNWPLLLAILTGPIGVAVLLIHQHWDQITAGFRAVVSGIQTGVGDIVSFLTGLPGRIAGAAESLGSTLLHGILHGLGSAASAVGDFISQIARGFKNMINTFILDPIRGIEIKWGGIHGIGKFDIHPFSFIPRLHSGGVFQSWSAAGEGLALLRDGERVLTPEQDRGGRGGHTYITQYGAADPQSARRLQEKWNRRNGIVLVTTP